MANEVSLFLADWAIATGVPGAQDLSPVCVSPRFENGTIVFDVVRSIEAGRYRATKVPTWRVEPMKGWRSTDAADEDEDVEVSVIVKGEARTHVFLFAPETFTQLKAAVKKLLASISLDKVRTKKVVASRNGKHPIPSTESTAEATMSLASPGKHR